MNDLQIFNNPEFGDIREVTIDGEAWFVGRDIALALGYAKPQNAIATHVDIEDTLKQGILSKGGTQQTTLINESGLYALIIMSEIPSAKKFKRWVTKEVLPSIIKTGSYNAPQPQLVSPNELIIKMAQANIDLENKVNAIEKKLDTALQVLSQPTIGNWRDDMDNAIKELVSTYGLGEPKFRAKVYRELETVSGYELKARTNNLKRRMKKQGYTYKEQQAVTYLDTISKDKLLRTMFEGVFKKYQALYSMQGEQFSLIAQN